MKKQVLAGALVGLILAAATTSFAQSRASTSIDAHVNFKHVEKIEVLGKSFTLEGDVRWVETYSIIQDKNANIIIIH